jgi:hypothetical protein
MQYGMLTYAIPLARFADTYNGQPLGALSVANQKNHVAIYRSSARPSHQVCWVNASSATQSRLMLADAVVIRGPAASWPLRGEWNMKTRLAHTALMASSYRAAGIDRFIVAGVVESQPDVDRLRTALGATRLAVCRLDAPFELIEARVRSRESEETIGWFLDRARTLAIQLGRDGLDTFVVDASPTPRVVAADVIGRLGWVASA